MITTHHIVVVVFLFPIQIEDHLVTQPVVYIYIQDINRNIYLIDIIKLEGGGKKYHVTFNFF